MIRDRQTDRQTDIRTDGRPGKNNMSPNPSGGDIITHTETSHPENRDPRERTIKLATESRTGPAHMFSLFANEIRIIQLFTFSWTSLVVLNFNFVSMTDSVFLFTA